MKLYLVTNKMTGTQYIGKTTWSVEKRWRQHLANAKNRCTTYLHKAIRKYGVEAFTVQEFLFEPQDEKSLNEWEKFLITGLKGVGKLYNLTDGGEGSLGLVFSEETRRKMREAHTGKTLSDGTRRKLSEVGKGRIFSEEHRRKLSEAAKRRTHSPETRRKISEGSKRRHSAC